MSEDTVADDPFELFEHDLLRLDGQIVGLKVLCALLISKLPERERGEVLIALDPAQLGSGVPGQPVGHDSAGIVSKHAADLLAKVAAGVSDFSRDWPFGFGHDA